MLVSADMMLLVNNVICLLQLLCLCIMSFDYAFMVNWTSFMDYLTTCKYSLRLAYRWQILVGKFVMEGMQLFHNFYK